MKKLMSLLTITMLITSVGILHAQDAEGNKTTETANLRTFDSKELLEALASNSLLRPGGEDKKSEIRVLGAVRATNKGRYIEVSDRQCNTWKKIPVADVVSATETLVPSVSCEGEKYPYLRLVLEQKGDLGSKDREGPVVFEMTKSSSFINFPNISVGGSSLVSDEIFDGCTDIYLGCQLEECAGQGQWCLDMCESEFDFCIRDR